MPADVCCCQSNLVDGSILVLGSVAAHSECGIWNPLDASVIQAVSSASVMLKCRTGPFITCVLSFCVAGAPA